jgi:trigger factor
MQVTETLSDGLKRAYTIVLPAADIESRRTARLTNLTKTVRLAGFRPGRVPMPVVRQRFGSAVSAEVLQESVSEATQTVLTERGLRPAMQPKLDIVTEDPAAPSAAKDIEFKLELELMPDIAMPDFSTIRLTRLKSEVAPETVDAALENIAKAQRTLEPLTEEQLAGRGGNGGAQPGDVVTVDFIGKVDGTEFPGGKGDGVNVELGGGGFIPGFAEQLEGIKPGEHRTITVTFPADYGAADLAGKEATFDITAHLVNQPVVLPADQALAEKLGFDSLDEMREMVVQQQQREYDQLSRLRIKRELLDALTGMVTFPVPEGMVEREFDQIWQRLTADRDAGRLDEEDKAKDDETLHREYRPIAERRVRLGLLMNEIGRTNNITVTDEELARAMRREASRYPGQESQMMELFRKYPALLDNLRGPIFEEKIVDFLLETAQVTEQVVLPEELAKEPPVTSEMLGAAADASGPVSAAEAASAPEAAPEPKPAPPESGAPA